MSKTKKGLLADISEQFQGLNLQDTEDDQKAPITVQHGLVRDALKLNRSTGDLPLSVIDPDPDQVRVVSTSDEAFQGLVASIKEHGVIQPITVRFLAKNKPPRFQIISGERRYQAATRAGLKTIPVVIRDLDDTLKSIHQLVENLQREDLNPIEEARAFQRYLAATNKTQAQLAQEIGKSKGYVSRILTLLERLTMAEQEELAKVSPAKLPGKSLIYEASGIKDPKTRLSILRGELTREQGREKVSTFKKKPLGGRPRSVRQQFTQLPNNPVKITASYPKGTTLDQVLEALIQARKEIDD